MTTKKKLINHFLYWVSLWIRVIDNVVGILTLGFYNPMLHYYISILRYWINQRIK